MHQSRPIKCLVKVKVSVRVGVGTSVLHDCHIHNISHSVSKNCKAYEIFK